LTYVPFATTINIWDHFSGTLGPGLGIALCDLDNIAAIFPVFGADFEGSGKFFHQSQK